MIVATAGHVDHGKTALVEALTGVDTDRLAEEKRRGLTIEPGFAYRHLDGGRVLGFVDVPGHERFIRNMLAGVAAIDFALLVVAADDGVMPQTREHVDILDLLGVTSGAVALTKTDLVDAARIDTVITEISDLLAGTSLAGAPVLPVSSVSGTGIAELDAHLAGEAARWRARAASGAFRFSIDRAFSLAGAGVVVTGAVVAGSAAPGESLMLSPAGTTVRVRGIRAHDREATQARAGARCALNVAARGLHKDHIRRGDWLVAPSRHAPVTRLDARVRLLSSETKTLRRGATVHIHIGAAETTGRLAVLDGPALAPGGEALVQLALDRPVAAWSRDRLVLRDRSARRTIGGGHVLDPFARARGRAAPRRLAALAALDAATPGEALARLLARAAATVDLAWFAQIWNLTGAESDRLLKSDDVVAFGPETRRHACTAGRWAEMLDCVRAALERWHDTNPGSMGARERDLRAAPSCAMPGNLFTAALRRLVDNGVAVHARGVFGLASRQTVEEPDADREFRDRVRSALAADGLRPPTVNALSAAFGIPAGELRKRLERLARRELAVEVSANRFFLPEQLRRLAELARETARDSADGRFTVRDFRDRTGIGRNLAIEVLEHFDRTRLTAPDGDARRTMRPGLAVRDPCTGGSRGDFPRPSTSSG